MEPITSGASPAYYGTSGASKDSDNTGIILDGLRLIPTIADTHTTLQFELVDPAANTRVLINIRRADNDHYSFQLNGGQIEGGFTSPYQALAYAIMLVG